MKAIQVFKSVGYVVFLVFLALPMPIDSQTKTKSFPNAVPWRFESQLILEQGDAAKPLLHTPRDLDFDPASNGSALWVVNRGAPYRVTADGSYLPNGATTCEWRYGSRQTPPENSQFWPSFTIIRHPGTPRQSQENIVDPWGIHFLAEASSIAFGSRHFSPPHHGPSEVTDNPADRSSFGTCGESRNEMKGCVDWHNGKWKPSTPLDFQGPSLWSTDPAVFAQKNAVADAYIAKSFCNGSPDAEACQKNYTDPVCPAESQACRPGDKGRAFTLGSHLDMLHESPLCMGIAWERKNAYWVFDGCGGAQIRQQDRHLASGHGEKVGVSAAPAPGAPVQEKDIPPCKEHGDIVRYDFRVDHGAGFDDHCDGFIERYAIGQVKRVDGVPSHMVMWGNHLFIADSGNKRIARLNPAAAGRRSQYSPPPLSERVNDACTVAWDMEYAHNNIVRTYFAHDGMDTPSGMALLPKAALPVKDNSTSKEVLVVSDNKNSTLLFLSLDVAAGSIGRLLGVIDVSPLIRPGGLMGLAVHPVSNDIYLTDAVQNKVWSIGRIKR